MISIPVVLVAARNARDRQAKENRKKGQKKAQTAAVNKRNTSKAKNRDKGAVEGSR